MIEEVVKQIWMLKDFYSIDEMLDFVKYTNYDISSITYLYTTTVKQYRNNTEVTPNIYLILEQYTKSGETNDK